jgi:hypothetical protein
MKNLRFIRAGLWIEPLVTERVEDILPKLREATHPAPEPDRQKTEATIDRM